MLFFKMLGAVLLLATGIGGAVTLNRRAEARIDRVEAWISLLRLTKNQIDCFSLPLGEILGRCEGTVLRRMGWEASAAPEDFSALLSLTGEGYLSEEGGRIAAGFCEEIGKGYRGEQLRTCDYSIGLFCAERDRLLSALPGCRKRNTTLLMALAVFTVIILL